MARTVSEADRLRQCRDVFQRAVRDRVSMDQARTTLSLERIRARQARIEALRSRSAGTVPPQEPEFLDRIAAGRRAERSAKEAYARTCALLGEHDEGDDA